MATYTRSTTVIDTPTGDTTEQAVMKLDTDVTKAYTDLNAHHDLTEAHGFTDLTNGQLHIGNTGAAPVAAALTAGGGITITNAAGAITVAQSSTSMEFFIDGGGAAIATGIKGYFEVPFNCTLTQWTILADQSGAIKIDVWVDSYANHPPTNADTITGGHEPEIAASGTKAQDTDLSDWGDVTITPRMATPAGMENPNAVAAM